jgi:hypothetical protein
MSAETENPAVKDTRLRWVVISGIAAAVLATLVFVQIPSKPRLVHLAVKVSDAKSQEAIPHAQIRGSAVNGDLFSVLTDDNGMAAVTFPSGGSERNLVHMVVVADGFIESNIDFAEGQGNRLREVLLTPVEGSAKARTEVTKLDVLSGEGTNWGNLYEICSAPAPLDYRVVASKFELIAQDRQCGLYAECSESSHSNSRVCWTVRLQGRSETSSATRRIQGKAILTVTVDNTNIPPAKVTGVCHFYGQANQGSSAWNKDEQCAVPEVELLDKSFRQADFICCGGGATSATTNANIPSGLEVRASGAHYWAVIDPRLEGNQFKIHTYCGPTAAPGPGCNVDVQVVAHYRQ